MIRGISFLKKKFGLVWLIWFGLVTDLKELPEENLFTQVMF